jgi:uncharacterized protein YeaO (DUF488 family)
MPIAIKRAFELPKPGDGHRILVDRLWPRGLSKDEIGIAEWMKEAAPSDHLRKSFHGGQITWGEFRRRYLSELKLHRRELQRLARISKEGNITLVFGAHDKERNNAVVLAQYLRMLGAS